MRRPAQYPDLFQLFSLPMPNGVKVGLMLEETGTAYEPHRIDIMAHENHDPAFSLLGWVRDLIGFYDGRELVGFNCFLCGKTWLGRGLTPPAVQRRLVVMAA